MRKINATALATRRKAAPSVATPAPRPERHGFALMYSSYAFTGSVHRIDCACTREGTGEPVMLHGASLIAVQSDDLVLKLRARGWNIRPAGCVGDG